MLTLANPHGSTRSLASTTRYYSLTRAGMFQGGFDNVEVARSYYSRAVKLSSATNMRALYGLLLVSATTGGGGRCGGGRC